VYQFDCFEQLTSCLNQGPFPKILYVRPLKFSQCFSKSMEEEFDLAEAKCWSAGSLCDSNYFAKPKKLV